MRPIATALLVLVAAVGGRAQTYHEQALTFTGVSPPIIVDLDARDGTLYLIGDEAGALASWTYDFDAAATSPDVVVDRQTTLGLPGTVNSAVVAGGAFGVAFMSDDLIEVTAGGTSRVGLAQVSHVALNPNATVTGLAAGIENGSMPNVWRRSNVGVWTPTMTAAADALEPAGIWLVLADGDRGVALAKNGRVYATDTLAVDDSWALLADTGLLLHGAFDAAFRQLGDAALLDSGTAIFTSVDSGLLLVDSAGGFVTCALSSSVTFGRIAVAGGTLFGMEDPPLPGIDVLHEVASVESACADGSIEAGEETLTSTGSPVARGPAAWLDTSTEPPTPMVIFYNQLSGPTHQWTWRNRPPQNSTPPGIDGTSGPNGEVTTISVGMGAFDPDPEPGAPTYEWTCEEAGWTIVDNGTSADITVTTSVCPAAAGMASNCYVTLIDGEGERSQTQPVSIAWLVSDPDLPTLQSPTLEDENNLPLPQDASDVWQVARGQRVTASVVPQDTCPVAVTWTSADNLLPTPTVVGNAVTFDAPVVDGTYTLDVALTDEGNNPPATERFTLEVAVPTPPTITCDPVAIDATDQALQLPLTFDISPNVTGLTFACPAGAPCTDVAQQPNVDISACATDERIEITFQPEDPLNRYPDPLAPVTCVVDVSAPDTTPQIVIVGDDEVIVPLDEKGANAELVVDADEHACDPGRVVRWDLDDVHAAFRTGCGPSCEVPVATGEDLLVLAAEPISFDALHDTTAIVRVENVSATGARSEPVTFTLRFLPVADLGTRAGVRATILAPDVQTLPEGDVVRVRTRVETLLGFSLPRLTLELEDGELEIVPDRLEVATNACGAGASIQHEAGLTRVVAEGVTATCPLDVDLLARRGLSTTALKIARCAWGADDRPIAPCTSVLDVERPRGLGCAASEPARLPLAALALLLVLLRFGRRRQRR